MKFSTNEQHPSVSQYF